MRSLTMLSTKGLRLPITLCLTLCLGLVTTLAHATQTVTYYHSNALGSPVAATDAAGNVLWREAYEPYGLRLIKDANSSGNSRYFTGHPEDASTGLTYMGSRFYDPRIGRFMSPDPVRFKEANLASFNRYAYGNHNPYKYVDPDGESSIVITPRYTVAPRAALEPVTRIAPSVSNAAANASGRAPFAKPNWGHNRFMKEMYRAGYKYDQPATGKGGGARYRNPLTGEEIRVHPSASSSAGRNVPPAKTTGSHYYKYKPKNGEWGNHQSIPQKPSYSPGGGGNQLPSVTVPSGSNSDPCAGNPHCT